MSFYDKVVGDWLNFQLLLAGGLIAAGVVYGLTAATPYDVQIVTLTVVFAIMGVGWTIAAGLAGQLLIGYICFFGVGAYVNAILLTKFGFSPWINLGFGAVAGAAVAILAASISVRFGLNEDYFGLFTIALSQILKILFLNWAFAGKAMGVSIPVREWDFAMMSFPEKTPYLFIALGLLAAALVLSYGIQRGRLGLYFAAVRESPMAAEALGVNVTRFRIAAIAISGAVAGCAGAFYAQFTSFIDPEKVFGLSLNFDFLLAPVLGGRLSLIGPVLGALVLRPVKDVLRGWMGGEADALYLIILGLVLVVGILVMPRGIAGPLQWLHAKFLARR